MFGFFKSLATLASVTAAFAADPAPGLTVHEWGTFTTVAAEDGSSEPWISLERPADLPCFVNHLAAQCVKCGANRVRMETPVVYFYSSQPVTASVHVDLPSGLITEWYPQATVKSSLSPGYTYGGDGNIEWSHVQIVPGADMAYRNGGDSSHYYAARETDSAPLRVGNEPEKVLFYRGIANFEVPVQARFLVNGQLQVRNTGKDPLEFAVVFENRSGRIGYQILRNFQGEAAVDSPDLNASVDSVQEELRQALVAAGLYPKEAAAMVATWSDSWFDEGMRIFYAMPRRIVDNELPIRINPKPETLERVFVGRIEVLSPAMHETVAAALASGDTKVLSRCSRFLRPWLEEIRHSRGLRISPAAAAYMLEAEKALTQGATAPCRAEPAFLPTEQH